MLLAAAAAAALPNTISSSVIFWLLLQDSTGPALLSLPLLLLLFGSLSPPLRSHEYVSCQLLELALQEAGGIDLSTQDMQLVCDMIDNGPHRQLRQQQQQDQMWRLQVRRAAAAAKREEVLQLWCELELSAVPQSHNTHRGHAAHTYTPHCLVAYNRHTP